MCLPPDVVAILAHPQTVSATMIAYAAMVMPDWLRPSLIANGERHSIGSAMKPAEPRLRSSLIASCERHLTAVPSPITSAWMLRSSLTANGERRGEALGYTRAELVVAILAHRER